MASARQIRKKLEKLKKPIIQGVVQKEIQGSEFLSKAKKEELESGKTASGGIIGTYVKTGKPVTLIDKGDPSEYYIVRRVKDNVYNFFVDWDKIKFLVDRYENNEIFSLNQKTVNKVIKENHLNNIIKKLKKIAGL